MSKTVICMWSGGLDSTGMLYKFLTEEKYKHHKIHAHFIRIINSENRDISEQKAVDTCLEWFRKNCRSFIFTQSIVDLSCFKRITKDAEIYNFVASEIIKCETSPYIRAVGRTKSDMELWNGRVPVHISDPEKRFLLKFDKYKKLGVIDITLEYPMIDMTKREIWDMLPDALRNNIWSCRKPRYINGRYKSCRECVTCKEFRKNGLGLK